MLSGLIYWLLTLLPEVSVPLFLTDGISDMVTFVYWANYYFPVDVAFKCACVYFGYIISLYFLKFMFNSISSTASNL